MYICGCIAITCSLSYALGDPISISIENEREWEEATRLYYYNQEKELLMHGMKMAAILIISIINYFYSI